MSTTDNREEITTVKTYVTITSTYEGTSYLVDLNEDKTYNSYIYSYGSEGYLVNPNANNSYFWVQNGGAVAPKPILRLYIPKTEPILQLGGGNTP